MRAEPSESRQHGSRHAHMRHTPGDSVGENGWMRQGMARARRWGRGEGGRGTVWRCLGSLRCRHGVGAASGGWRHVCGGGGRCQRTQPHSPRGARSGRPDRTAPSVQDPTHPSPWPGGRRGRRRGRVGGGWTDPSGSRRPVSPQQHTHVRTITQARARASMPKAPLGAATPPASPRQPNEERGRGGAGRGGRREAMWGVEGVGRKGDSFSPRPTPHAPTHAPLVLTLPTPPPLGRLPPRRGHNPPLARGVRPCLGGGVARRVLGVCVLAQGERFLACGIGAHTGPLRPAGEESAGALVPRPRGTGAASEGKAPPHRPPRKVLRCRCAPHPAPAKAAEGAGAHARARRPAGSRRARLW